MKKVVAKRAKREEAQPEPAKRSEKSEPEIEAAIMALPLETQTLPDRLGEMLEEFGSWVDYRVRLDEEVLVVAFDVCSSCMIMEQLLIGGDVSCLTDLLTAIKRHLAAEQKHLQFDPYKFTGDGLDIVVPS